MTYTVIIHNAPDIVKQFSSFGDAYNIYCECVNSKIPVELFKNDMSFLYYNPVAYTERGEKNS